jgi:chemotaxis protein CheD
MGEFLASRDPRDELVTYALGTCLGLAAWDPRARAGALLHFMLPDSSISPERARLKPAMFADTGIGAMLAALEALGASPKSLVIKIAGAAALGGERGFFDIGQRNLLAAKRLLWKRGLGVDGEETGGSAIRTLRLHISDGRALFRDAASHS